METLVQFSMFLFHKPGKLSQIFQELAKAKINVTGIAMMDAMEHGVLRMIVEHPAGARDIFRKLNVETTETKVLAVPLSNRPGAVADICEKLANAHINLGYMYCTAGARGGKTIVYMKVPSIPKAMKVLDGTRNNRRDMKVKLRRPASTRR